MNKPENEYEVWWQPKLNEAYYLIIWNRRLSFLGFGKTEINTQTRTDCGCRGKDCFDTCKHTHGYELLHNDKSQKISGPHEGYPKDREALINIEVKRMMRLVRC